MKLTVKGAIAMKNSDQPKIQVGVLPSKGNLPSAHQVTFDIYQPVDIEKLLQLVTKRLTITLEVEEEKLTTL